MSKQIGTWKLKRTKMTELERKASASILELPKTFKAGRFFCILLVQRHTWIDGDMAHLWRRKTLRKTSQRKINAAASWAWLISRILCCRKSSSFIIFSSNSHWVVFWQHNDRLIWSYGFNDSELGSTCLDQRPPWVRSVPLFLFPLFGPSGFGPCLLQLLVFFAANDPQEAWQWQLRFVYLPVFSFRIVFAVVEVCLCSMRWQVCFVFCAIASVSETPNRTEVCVQTQIQNTSVCVQKLI